MIPTPELEAASLEIAEALSARLPDVMFTLFLSADPRPGGRMIYISNVRRDQMLEALRDFLERASPQ